MKTGLLNKDKIYRLKEFSEREKTIISDMELNDIFNVASKKDNFLKNVFSHVLLDSQTTKEDILYRQETLKALYSKKELAWALYKYTRETEAELNTNYRFGIVDDGPMTILNTSIVLLKYLIPRLMCIKPHINRLAGTNSEALNSFIEDSNRSFNDELLTNANKVINSFEEENGFMMSQALDDLMNDVNQMVHRSTYFDQDQKKRWHKCKKITFPFMTESIGEEVRKKQDRCVESISPIIGRATNDIMDFFSTLRIELGFYCAAMNLIDYLEENSFDYCYPISNDAFNCEYTNLYDLALSIKLNQMAVGNNHSSNKPMFVITGANQGGKTTFLRSFGQALLLHQAGIIVPAKELTLGIYQGFYTHFDKAEDVAMESGKLDEELKRLSIILDDLKPNYLLMLNESFQSTNEHEGSLLGFKIIKALHEGNIKMLIVTHMYELSIEMLNGYKNEVYFLRAGRDESGNRSYTLEENEPLTTSFAMDLYDKILR